MRASIASCTSAALLYAVAACTPVEPPGPTAPPLRFAALDGGASTSLAAFCGQVLYVEFWGSWCEPCKRSLPEAARLRDTVSRADLDVIAVSLDPEAAAARTFLATQRITLPSFWDPGQTALAALDISGVPTVVLIDREGRLRDRIEGYTDETRTRVRQRVQRLVAERASGACAHDAG